MLYVLLAPLEELHCPLVLFGGGEALERAEILALSTLILLAGIEAVLSGFQLSNHANLL